MRETPQPKGSVALAVRRRWKSWWQQAGWDEFVGVTKVFIFVVSLGLFFELSSDAAKGGYLVQEQNIMRGLRDAAGLPVGPAWLPGAVRDITALGSATLLSVIGAALAGFLCVRRRYRAALLIAFATIGGQIVNKLLKMFFDRARPDVSLHLLQIDSESFPSGHAMSSATFYLTLGMLLAEATPRRREKIFIMATAVVLISLTGLSRIYLGVHYPADVAAGWAGGTLWAIFCHAVARRAGASLGPAVL